MPTNLREAHERNDETLERIYIGRRFKNDTDRLEKMFELCTRMPPRSSSENPTCRRRRPGANKNKLSGSLPFTGRVGEGIPGLMYRDQEQRDFARQLRNEATPAETRLWHFLRAGRLGVKFRRQAAIGAYIVDFVCFSHSLIVELDGPQHLEDKGKEQDARRTAWLASRGFRVIRFRNQALDEDIWLVVDEIKRALRQPPSPALPAEGREQDKS